MGTNKPLSGTRVVSFCINVPGPVAAAKLSGLGAAVTKIEPPGGDPLAKFAPDWYVALTGDQDIHEINLKEPDGLRKVLDMLASADMLLTSQRLLSLKRLALDWDALHARFPRLCQVAIIGRARPNQEVPGHDLTYLAEFGLLSPPTLPLTLVADLAGAEQAVAAALAMLLVRERSGEPGYSEVSLAEAAREFSLPLSHGVTTPGGLLGGGLPTYGIYATQDGYIALAAVEPSFHKGLLEGLDIAKATREELERIFLSRTADQWETWAAERDLPIVAVRACRPHKTPGE